MLLADASPIGNNYWLIVGPMVFAAALVVWVWLTVRAARHRTRSPDKIRGEASHRGPVQGGVIEGSPSQRSRRDEAPRQS